MIDSKIWNEKRGADWLREKFGILIVFWPDETVVQAETFTGPGHRDSALIEACKRVIGK